MAKELSKDFSYGAVAAFVLILVLLAVGAMFFSDDVDDIFEHKPKVTQAMELRGKWLGMDLVALDSATARRLGAPPSAQGVMVIEIGEKAGWRARQAGVLEGDIIAAVEGKKIRDLAGLYAVSRRLDVRSALLLDIQRWGQPMTLVLPAVYAMPPVAAPAQAGQAGRPQPAPMAAQGANAGAIQPLALAQAAQEGAQFYCPQHNRVWSQSAVHPNYRCPLGNCPLNRVR